MTPPPLPLATAQYANPRTGQTATLMLYPVVNTVACAMHLDEEFLPTWYERCYTEVGARQCARLWHQRLKRNYGMTLVKTAQTENPEARAA